MDFHNYKIATQGHEGPLKIQITFDSDADKGDITCVIDRLQSVSEEKNIWLFRDKLSMTLYPRTANQGLSVTSGASQKYNINPLR